MVDTKGYSGYFDKQNHGPFTLTEIKEKELSPPCNCIYFTHWKEMCEQDAWKDVSEFNW